MRWELERVEKAGRATGVGYSAVVIGMIRLVISGLLRVASSNHSTAGER